VSERVQIFAEGSFVAGDLTWGWQCFNCRDERTGFGAASTAGEGRDNHAATCGVYAKTRPTPSATDESEK